MDADSVRHGHEAGLVSPNFSENTCTRTASQPPSRVLSRYHILSLQLKQAPNHESKQGTNKEYQQRPC
jgi:hypothetical protein